MHLPPDCESTDELVPQRLGLRDGAQTPRGHLLGVQLDGALGEVEALLHHGGQLADAPALLSEHVLGGCSVGDHSIYVAEFHNLKDMKVSAGRNVATVQMCSDTNSSAKKSAYIAKLYHIDLMMASCFTLFNFY